MVAALRYLGGKSETSSTGVGPWIASLLPYRHAYMEPFAGMLGVLCHRSPSNVEIVNDLDNRIITWWLAIRDYPEEFAWLVRNTPHSRSAFLAAASVITDSSFIGADSDKDEILAKAIQTHIFLSQSYSRSFHKGIIWDISTMKKSKTFYDTNVLDLADRIKDVALECCDATDILERYAGNEDIVIYCDPVQDRQKTVCRAGGP